MPTGKCPPLQRENARFALAGKSPYEKTSVPRFIELFPIRNMAGIDERMPAFNA